MALTRRSLLTGFAAAVGLSAGCTGTGPGTTPTRTPTKTPTPTATRTPSPTPGPRIREASLRSLDTGCGSRASASIAFDGADVTITGDIVASTPCYRAVLLTAAVEDGTARFVVDVRKDVEGTSACVQCLGEVSFELSASFAKGTPSEVVVELRGAEPLTARRAVPG